MFFLLYIKCVGTQKQYLTIVHIKERRKDSYRYKRMATETKKSRNFHKLLPRLSKRLRGGYYLPHKKLFLILNLLYVSIYHGHGCDVYDILYTAL